MNPPQSGQEALWDCRWPDAIALRVATERLLLARGESDPALNQNLPIRVHMDPPENPEDPMRAILVTPWAVERIYWSNPAKGPPPIRHAAALERDQTGRAATGQGVLLETEERQIPVQIAWEPETGHHFVETVLHSVRDFDTPDEAIATALGTQPPPKTKQSLSNHLQKKMSRRRLLGLLGG